MKVKVRRWFQHRQERGRRLFVLDEQDRWERWRAGETVKPQIGLQRQTSSCQNGSPDHFSHLPLPS
jgi:hypothetical protein